MKSNEKKSVSNEKIRSFYTESLINEANKKEAQARVMVNQLQKVTGGKNIVISNNCR